MLMFMYIKHNSKLSNNKQPNLKTRPRSAVQTSVAPPARGDRPEPKRWRLALNHEPCPSARHRRLGPQPAARVLPPDAGDTAPPGRRLQLLPGSSCLNPQYNVCLGSPGPSLRGAGQSVLREPHTPYSCYTTTCSGLYCSARAFTQKVRVEMRFFSYQCAPSLWEHRGRFVTDQPTRLKRLSSSSSP